MLRLAERKDTKMVIDFTAHSNEITEECILLIATNLAEVDIDVISHSHAIWSINIGNNEKLLAPLRLNGVCVTFFFAQGADDNMRIAQQVFNIYDHFDNSGLAPQVEIWSRLMFFGKVTEMLRSAINMINFYIVKEEYNYICAIRKPIAQS